MTFTSLRRALMAATIACGLLSAQQAAQQKGPQPKSQKERDALMKVQTAAQANNADELLKAIDYVLENFDNSDYKVMLLTMGMEASQAKGDTAKSSVYADRLIEADPNNIASRVMQAESIAQRTRENDLDKEQSLKKVDELADKGLELLKNASTPPPGANEAQWPEMKKQLTSEAHDAKGQASELRKNYPEAIKHYQEALEAQPTNAVATARLAKAYVGNKQYDEAISTADKVTAMADAPAVVKQFAQQQKDAATKLKGSGAK
jgi:tetratricopeptide (TPR) repeat protein